MWFGASEEGDRGCQALWVAAGVCGEVSRLRKYLPEKVEGGLEEQEIVMVRLGLCGLGRGSTLGLCLVGLRAGIEVEMVR